jgi:glycosyltransferase involved in cell wall biosynthesis
MSIDTPLISVLMPAYNAEKYIEEAIESVFAQTYTNFELIIVNDGSSDATAKILEQYSDRATIITQENKGQCAACNRAFKESSGDFIKFFDADDILSPDMLEKQAAVLQRNNECVALSAWARFYNDAPDTAVLQDLACFRDSEPLEWLIASFENGLNMMQCALWLIPRSVLLRAGLWDERLSLINDFDFIIRVLLASRGVRFVEGPCMYYRSGLDQSLSGSYSRQACESAFLSTELGVSTIITAENSARTRRIAALCFQSWAYVFYPAYPDLTEAAEQKVEAYGGSDYQLAGGSVFRCLSKLLGWKCAKRIRHLVHALGWQHVARLRWQRQIS